MTETNNTHNSASDPLCISCHTNPGDIVSVDHHQTIFTNL